MSQGQPLYLMQAGLNLKELQTWMGERSIESLDRAIHCLLTETLGEAAPRQFRVIAGRGQPTAALYGYTGHDSAQLTHNHQAFASPQQDQAMPAETIAAKVMPATWPANAQVAFDVRCRPLKQRNRTEVDAFWSMREANPAEEILRSDAYVKWITEYFARRGTAKVERASVQSYNRSQTETQRNQVTPKLPETVMKGLLTITDGANFTGTLAAGVGRHRAYGFGMLLIKPAIRRDAMRE